METIFLSEKPIYAISRSLVTTKSFTVSLSITFIVLIVSFYVISIRRGRKNAGDAPLPPGQKGLPVIGETLDYVRFNQRGHPEVFVFDRMRKFSTKIFRTSLMGQNMVVFCGSSANKFLFTSANDFVTMWLPINISKILISPKNTHHEIFKLTKESRKVTNELLKPESLQKRFLGIIDSISKQHIDDYWTGQQEVIVFELAKIYTFDIACRLFLSLDDPKRVKILKDLYKDITRGILSLPLNFPGTPFHRAIRASGAIRKQIESIIKQRKIDVLSKKTDTKDLLSQFLQSTFGQDGEFPSDAVIADLILGLLVAGHDTASSSITFMIKYLAELPHVYAKVLEEQMKIAKNKKEGESLNWDDIQQMKYTWSVAYETMRLSPAAIGGFREVLNDFTYDGFTIPKGWKIHWTVHSINKNSKYFKNPEDFDPTRFQDGGPAPFTFVPFGGGNHICPGREYARIEILVFIHNLVTRFHFEKVLPNEKIIYTIGAVPVNGLPIRLHPHKT